MALTKRNPAAQFEPAPAAAQPAATPAAAPAPAPAAQAQTPAPAPAPAADHTHPPALPIVTPPQHALATTPSAMPIVVKPNLAALAIAEGMKVTESLKDALHVDWDTFPRMKATQGRITASVGGAKIDFGKWFDFELLSYQDNWLVSPGGDTDEAKALAKYSDDGKTLKDTGQNIVEYVEQLKGMGYENARVGQRMVMLVSLLDCEGDATVSEGQLFQIDMPPTSRAAFEQYRKQSAFDISKGRLSSDAWASKVRALCNVETQKGKSQNEYTVLGFSRAPA